MKKLFWVDMEMTGLDEKIHHILEIAVVVTDLELKKLDEYQAVVFQTPEVMRGMDDWCTKTHGDSGLSGLVPHGKKLADVEKDVVTLLNKHFPKDERVVLVGNSVGNDRRFIDRYMPALAKRLHYRIIDVSSFKEIFRDRWGVKIMKASAHRASQDIFESIDELKTYLSYVNVPPPSSNTSTNK